jgi:PIN domain nuclease of toxin-antitoxin system
MRLLLDTHIFLWAVSNDKRLTKEARKYYSLSPKSVRFGGVDLGNFNQGCAR